MRCEYSISLSVSSCESSLYNIGRVSCERTNRAWAAERPKGMGSGQSNTRATGGGANAVDSGDESMAARKGKAAGLAVLAVTPANPSPNGMSSQLSLPQPQSPPIDGQRDPAIKQQQNLIAERERQRQQRQQQQQQVRKHQGQELYLQEKFRGIGRASLLLGFCGLDLSDFAADQKAPVGFRFGLWKKRVLHCCTAMYALPFFLFQKGEPQAFSGH